MDIMAAALGEDNVDDDEDYDEDQELRPVWNRDDIWLFMIESLSPIEVILVRKYYLTFKWIAFYVASMLIFIWILFVEFKILIYIYIWDQ